LGKSNTLAARRYTRANPNFDPPLVFENPNLIPKIIRKQERSLSPRPLIRSNSCRVKWLFLEDLLNMPFDEYFELSLFRTSSKTKLLDLVQDLVFLSELENQKEKLLSDRKLQTVDKIRELSASPSTYVVSTSPPKFISSIPQQPVITPPIPISYMSSTPPVFTNPFVISTSVSNLP